LLLVVNVADLSDNCTAIPGYCNGKATRCTAGKCTCTKGYSGRYCETKDNGVQHKAFTMHGKEYRLYHGEKLSWMQASQQCQQVGMRLVRLYSQSHARELDRRVVSEAKSGFVRIVVWIGLNARRGNGTFVWDSGTGDHGKDAAADFYLWEPHSLATLPCKNLKGLCPSDDPRNYASDSSCVVAEFGKTGQWSIANCSQPHMYICGEADEESLSDPCVRHPCSSGGRDDDSRDSDVDCSPSPPSSPPSSSALSPSSVHYYNRTCTCKRGFHYISDEEGCVKRYNVEDFSTEEVTVVGLLHRIFLFPKVSWAQANQICCESGMKLVEIHNASHANQLHKAFEKRVLRGNYWIGLNDRDQEGTFTWTSGAGACLSNKNATTVALDAASYTRWGSGEPNNAVYRLEDEDCVEVVMVSSSALGSHAWNDIQCWHLHNFICMAVQN
jgi:hypothetical protein